MNLEATARPFRRDLRDWSARVFRRACEDLKIDLTAIARGADISDSKVQQWATEAKHTAAALPLWVLASPIATPDDLYRSLISALDRTRAETAPATPAITLEALAASVIQRIGDALSECGRALDDGVITSMELPELRRKLEAMRAVVDRMLERIEASSPRPLVAVGGSR